MSNDAMTDGELAAIDARNPDDLGRDLFLAIHPGSTGETAWRFYEAESRAPWIAAAASARKDVPRLVAEVRRLQAQIEATAEMHREDQRRRDELANVPG